MIANAAENPPRVFMIGDSTMADKNLDGGNPERGWGQLLPGFFQDGVKIENHAKDGRSTKSFFDEGLWTAVLADLKPGDWVIIQFGHNDQKKDKPLLYTNADTDYREFLTKYVKEAQAKGAHPILSTSIYRCHFTPEGKLKPSLQGYPEATRQTAAKLGVPLVDLNEMTRQLLESLGPEKSKSLFLHFAPGEIPFYPNGKNDNTHLCENGAKTISSLFVDNLKTQNIGLARWVKNPPKK